MASYVAVIRHVLQHGANINAATENTMSALDLATCQRCKRSARALIREGANIKARNNEGFTPLDIATQGQKGHYTATPRRRDQNYSA